MFFLRIISAMVLLPLVILVILKSSAAQFYYLSGLIMLVVAWEWSQFVTTVLYKKLLFVFTCFVCMLASQYIFLKVILWASVLFWCWCILAVVSYNRHITLGLLRSPVFIAISGLLCIVACWQSIIYIQIIFHGKALLYALILVWLADSGAYAGGRLFGKRLLIPRVSPKKTIEGLAAGLCVVAVFILIECYFHMFFPSSDIWLFIISMIVAFFSIVGDLMISLLKRITKIKDTGHLIPGHGGILDRLDSMLAALPIFCFLFIYLKMY